MIRRFFEQKCLICRKSIYNGEMICKQCMSDFKNAPETKIEYCEKVLSRYIYEDKAREIMLKFKFGDGDYDLYQDILAVWLIDVYKHNLCNIKFDYAISVPSYKNEFSRFKSVVKDFSSECNIIYSDKLLSKIRSTERQHDLNSIERSKNLNNAFKASTSVENKTILIVDDIITTGNTVKECAKTLIENGAKAVYAISVLKTP